MCVRESPLSITELLEEKKNENDKCCIPEDKRFYQQWRNIQNNKRAQEDKNSNRKYPGPDKTYLHFYTFRSKNQNKTFQSSWCANSFYLGCVVKAMCWSEAWTQQSKAFFSSINWPPPTLSFSLEAEERLLVTTTLEKDKLEQRGDVLNKDGSGRSLTHDQTEKI